MRRGARGGWRRGAAAALALPLAAWGVAAPAAAQRRLALHHTALELPGAPASVIATDLDGDGRRDLVVVVATTEWGELGIAERAEMDAVEGLVEVLTVVPALFDRREVRVFLADGDGSYRPAAAPLELPASVLSMEAGPAGLPVLALTDKGLAALRLEDPGTLALEPLVQDRPVFAGSGAFVPNLGMVQQLDGGGAEEILLPADDGVAIYRLTESGATLEAVARVALPQDERLPGDARHYRRSLVRHYPLPEVRDATGDGLPDLLVRNHQRGWNQLHLLRGTGGGRFAGPMSPLGDRPRDAEPPVVFFGDLDGDGRAEVVTVEDLGGGEGESLRRELKEARRPRFRYRVHPLGPDLLMRPEPARQLEVEGYAFGGSEDLPLPGGFQDLNGDGRQDLVTLTLDFSLFQAVKILAARRLTLGLDFHIWCQGADGGFRQVRDLDLAGEFRVNLNNLRLGQLSLFAGDFDGDGRADFVQMGRGKTVSLHRGRADCSYGRQPDLTIELEEAPRDLALVQVRDLDGDGRSDLMVTQPLDAGEGEATAPVRLDLYLSRGGGA